MELISKVPLDQFCAVFYVLLPICGRGTFDGDFPSASSAAVFLMRPDVLLKT